MGVQDGNFPQIKFYCLCSKGTYVRALVSDIGDALGSGAHLSELRRVYSHPFAAEQAYTIGAIEELLKTAKIDTIILNPKDFIIPAVTLVFSDLHALTVLTTKG